MSKTSIFIPLAAEYDPDEKESLQKSMGVSENELLSLMMKIGRVIKESAEEEDDENPPRAQQALMKMIQDKELSDNMLLYLACYGSQQLWALFADGIFLVLDAEAERKEEGK